MIDVVFGLHAKALGITPEQFRALMEGMTHRRRSTTLAELVTVAVFMASDRGGRDDRDGRQPDRRKGRRMSSRS